MPIFLASHFYKSEVWPWVLIINSDTISIKAANTVRMGLVKLVGSKSEQEMRIDQVVWNGQDRFLPIYSIFTLDTDACNNGGKIYICLDFPKRPMNVEVVEPA